MARLQRGPATSLATMISDPADDTMSDEILADAPDSNQENFVPGRSGLQKNKTAMANSRAKSAANKPNKVTKSRVAARKPSRREIIEQEDIEEDEGEDVDELDDMDAAPAPEPPKARGRQPAKAKIANTGRVMANSRTDEAAEYKYAVRQSPRKGGQRVNGTHPVPQAFHEIQSDPVDADGLSDVDLMIEELAQPTVQPVAQQRARSTSQQPVILASTRHRRAGSTSSNEGKNPDPALRRKLGELTKKFEALEVKHRKLHDVGISEAKANFDKLKATSDEKARISNELIQSLKKELAAQKSASQQAQTRIHEADSHKSLLADIRAQLAAAQREITELKTERSEVKAELAETKAQLRSHATVDKQLSDSKTQIAALTKQLSESQREQANLQAKLATARSSLAEKQAPGSAVKGSKVPVMKVMTTTAEAAAAVQEANSKVDLYTDLTGLLVRGVERRVEERVDIFDCIQTGRNGTLHFKLSISTDTTESYDDAEFSYLPQLNAARDKDLMELLPYYLVEDIQFSRQEAAKFYSRVFDILTRKFEEGDMEEE